MQAWWEGMAADCKWLLVLRQQGTGAAGPIVHDYLLASGSSKVFEQGGTGLGRSSLTCCARCALCRAASTRPPSLSALRWARPLARWRTWWGTLQGCCSRRPRPTRLWVRGGLQHGTAWLPVTISLALWLSTQLACITRAVFLLAYSQAAACALDWVCRCTLFPARLKCSLSEM